MNENRTRFSGGSFQEKRRQADWVVNAASALSVASWLVAFSVLLLLDIASPERANFFSNVFEGTLRTAWNLPLLYAAFMLLILAVISCIAAFIFNMMRMRRKTDKYRKSIIVIGLVTVVGFIFFTMRFAGYLF